MRNKSGFSAVELIIVVVVIAIVIGVTYKIFTADSSFKAEPVPTDIPTPTDYDDGPSSGLPQIESGVPASEIAYTLPDGWVADLEGTNDQTNDLFIYPTEGGGFIAINVYDFDSSVTTQEYYCEVTDYCIDGVTTFELYTVGDLDGFKAISVDNSGGGSEYFASNYDKLYTVSTFSPLDPEAEYNLNGAVVFDSLNFSQHQYLLDLP